MSDLFKTMLALMGIAGLAALILTAYYLQVADQIDDPVELRYQEALRHCMPAVSVIHEREGTEPLPPRYWVAESGNRIAGYAFPVEAVGFSGPIRALAAVDTNGIILGITIISHMETSGFGSRIAEKIPQAWWRKKVAADYSYEPWFTLQFRGLSIQSDIAVSDSGEEWPRLTGDARQNMAKANTVTAVTGATQSTNALARAVADEIQIYLSILHKKV